MVRTLTESRIAKVLGVSWHALLLLVALEANFGATGIPMASLFICRFLGSGLRAEVFRLERG